MHSLALHFRILKWKANELIRTVSSLDTLPVSLHKSYRPPVIFLIRLIIIYRFILLIVAFCGPM